MIKRYFKHPAPYILALFFTLLYFALPYIADALTSRPEFGKSARQDGQRIVQYIQSGFVYPFQKMLNRQQEAFFVFPYLLIFFLLFRGFYLHTKKIWRFLGYTALGLFIFLYLFPNTLLIFDNKAPSKSYGSVSNGRIENSKRFPFRGDNFSTYSYPGYLLGRTFAHQKVKQTALDAYQACEKSCPNTCFVMGEIGLKKGGRFLPHRTHRNGLSVDFMTPLLKNKKPYRTHSIFNRWGYGLEFDKVGKTKKIEIDYETMANHLQELNLAAKKNGLRISKVIFDPILRPFLLKTKAGGKIKNLPFTKNRVVIRHDDHYHVDFVEQ